MEPTRNAWVPLAAWFRRHGATVVMVPPEQSADLRDYYSKHVKSDRLDSRLLARLPLLHPDGLRPAEGLGPADPLRRAVPLRGSLVKRRSVIVARLDSYLELLGPGWHAAFGGDLTLLTPLRFLAAGYADPHALRRLGKTRLTRLIWRYSHGAWGEEHASRFLAAAAETLQLWDTELSYPDLAEDIAAEARLALASATEIRDLDTKTRRAAAPARPRRHHDLRPRRRRRQRRPDPGPPRRPGPVPVPGRRPLFTGLVPSLTASGPAAATGRRPKPATPRCARPCSWPPTRPAAPTPPSPPATTGSWSPGQAPQLRALPHRPGPAHQDHRLLAGRGPLPDPRHRRHPAHRRPGPRRHHRHATRSPPSCAPAAAPATPRRGRAGDTRSRQALRHQPAPAPRYDHQPNHLTPLKNSTAWSSPPGSPAAAAAATPSKHELRRLGISRRTASRTTPRPRARSNGSSRP